MLREGLDANGFVVAVLNAPLGLDTDSRVRILEHPIRLFPLLAFRLLRAWTQLILGWARQRSSPDVIVVGHMGHFDVLLARVLYPQTPIVLDYLISAADTALDRRQRPGIKTRLLQTLDQLATSAADLVLIDTPESLTTVPSHARSKCFVVAVGAPQEWFHKPEVARRRLEVAFFGVYTPLQGAPIVGRALSILQDRGVDFHASMIGHGQDLAATRVLAPDRSVTWHHWIPGEILPEVVAAHDVCLGIFGTTAKARRVVPNKVYQGAAAGCVVVTSGTEPQRACLAPHALFVPPGDAEALADVLQGLAEDEQLLRLRVQTWEHAVSAFSPDSVTKELAACLRGAHLRTGGHR